MNVLIDYHHGELYESLLKLFEDRLKFNVYRPIGVDWYTENYWKISDNQAVVDQYLNFEKFVYPLNQFGFIKEIENGIYIDEWYRGFKNVDNERKHKCVTLAAAKEIKWDIVVSTIREQFEFMDNFIKKYCPSAKHILQMGNYSHGMNCSAKNILNSSASTFDYDVPNYIEYHQEFDLIPFTYKVPDNLKSISSFLHFNSRHKSYKYFELEKELSDWIFKEYGVDCRDGIPRNYQEQCDKILDSAFIWHVKLIGDGYGYNLYKTLAAGRPLVINYSHFYKNHHRIFLKKHFDIEKTIIDYQKYFDPTELNFDNKSSSELKMELLIFKEKWQENSIYIYNRFREIINFDYEFESIKKFIEKLV